MIFQTLNGKWVMNERGSDGFVEASVPGSVLSALLVQHRIQDPFFGTNEIETREMFRNDFLFAREFEILPELLEQERIRLCLKGVDTISRIFVNNVLVGQTNNMHRTYYFDVKQYLRMGVNTIMVEIFSPLNYINTHKPSYNKEILYSPKGCLPGSQYLRKAHTMFGWSNNTAIPDCGIWRSIDLIGYSLIRIDDVLITQHHEKSKVSLEIRVRGELFRQGPYIIQTEVVTPEGRVSAITETMTGTEVTLFMDIESPKLWWPRGFGAQPLYTVSVFALDMNGNQWDSKSFKVGLRTMSVYQERDEYGRSFGFSVNGVRIFAMGANYIPEDTIYPFITKEKIDYLLNSAVKCNFNTIRVWGGGYYPSDTFYDLCDEYGLIVWQDLMFASNIYDASDDFKKNVEAEVRDNITRIRHHACLGIICGNSDIERSFVANEEFKMHSDEFRSDYYSLFEELIPDIAYECAPSTFYWKSSPSSGGAFDNPAAEDRGDSAIWDVWEGLAPLSDFAEHNSRFVSSFGFQSYPSIKTVNTFTREVNRNLYSEIIEAHQKDDNANIIMLKYMADEFLFPRDFESLLYLSQIQQALAVKSGVQQFRRNRECTAGSLYWHLNDSWPGASFSSIDYYGRWKPLQYFAKYFYANIAGSIVKNGNVMSVYIQNETRDFETCRAKVSLFTMDFRTLHEAEYEVDVPPFGVALVCELDYSQLIAGIENQVFVEVDFYDEEDNITSSEIEVFVPFKRLKLDFSSISYSVIELADEYVIRMSSGVFAAFVEVDLRQADAIFSDNYFHLTSKKEKTITLKKSDIRYLSPNAPEIQNGYELEQQLVIRTLRDTY